MTSSLPDELVAVRGFEPRLASPPGIQTSVSVPNRYLEERELRARLQAPRQLPQPAPSQRCPRCNGATTPTDDGLGGWDSEMRYCFNCGDVRVVPVSPSAYIPESARGSSYDRDVHMSDAKKRLRRSTPRGAAR